MSLRLACAVIPVIALLACTPAPLSVDGANRLCAPSRESTPASVDYLYHWREKPAQLAPDESVVEAVQIDSRALVIRRLENEQTGSHEPCTRVYAAALHTFQVTQRIDGPFDAPTFDLLQISERQVDFSPLTPPDDGKPAFLVISPEKYFDVHSPAPVMHARPAHHRHPCFPKSDISPVPGCETYYP